MFKYNQQINFEDNTSHGELVKFIKQGDAVLEFGCANGDFSAYIKDNLGCSVYGIEISNEAFERAKEHLDNGFCCDIEKYEWKKALGDLRFDTIVFADVLEHLRNPEKALREASEFLKDDGKIIFSVPNIAHSDVIIKLMQNSFDYTDIGILDNTHVHFFAKNNIKPFVESAGLFLSYLGATFVPLGSTEQKNECAEEKCIRLLRAQTNHDVYQFIGVCFRKEYAEQSKIDFRDVLSDRTREDISKIYVSNSMGAYSEENAFEFVNKNGEIDISIDVDSNKNKKIRLDIKEDSGYLIYDTFFGFDTEAVQPERSEGIKEYEGTYIIISDDSQFIFQVPKNATKFHAKAKIVEFLDKLSLDKICTVLDRFDLHKKEYYAKLSDLDSKYQDAKYELKKSDMKVENLKKTISRSEKKILSITKVAKSNESKIAQLENKIKDLNVELDHYKLHYHTAINQRTELTAGLANVTLKYDTISQSQSWKVTKPIRVTLDFIKKFPLFKAMSKFFSIAHEEGLKMAFKKMRRKFNIASDMSAARKEIYTSKQIEEQKKAKFGKDITISVIVPLYNTPENFLKEMIDSVVQQTYSKWELCLADGSDSKHKRVGEVCLEYANNDKRIKYKKLEKNLGISENTNACIDMSKGEYIALFDHDDILHKSALYEVMVAICEKNADFIYTDENTFSKTPQDAYSPNFKPDYAPDTLRSYNYICHLSVFSRELLDKVGKFRKEFDGSQDYDMILRLTEQAKNVVHIPKILYYWRSHKDSVASNVSAKPYTIEAAKKALSEHLERVGLKGTVGDSRVPSTYRINYDIEGQPLVSILIPNKDHIDDLDKCIMSIEGKSSYRNFEIIIIENNSTEKDTFDYYDLILNKYSNIKLVRWEYEFNYSKINNFGARFASGEYMILLNNDIEIITESWIEEMLMYAQRKDVGASGMMLYYPDNTVQHAGVILGIGGVAGHSHKYSKRGEYGYTSRLTIAQNLSAVTAAALMIRKDVWDEIGGLDYDFAIAFNDVDLCMQIRKAGYLIVWTPYAEAYHYESKSRGLEDTPEKQKRFAKEVEYFYSKWKKTLDMGDPYYNPNLTLERENFELR